MSATDRRSAPPVRYCRWSSEEFLRHLPTAMQIYGTAMGYPPSVLTARHGIAITHTRQRGFRSLGAHSQDGSLVGFGYGYDTALGQWWNSEVRRALGPHADTWLGDAFELCELHVLPEWQGHRIGRDLLTRLLEGLGGQNVVLSTPEGPTRARRLYESSGFDTIAANFYFATDHRPFAVMGRAGTHG